MATKNHTTKHCSIENCEKSVDRRGMCSTHYTRWKRHGNANTLLKTWKPRINAQNGEKFCTDCQTTKPVEQFHAHRGRADGLNEHCRECAIKRHRKFVPLAEPQKYPDINPMCAAYLAGLFDGEGCITIYERRRIDRPCSIAPFSLRLNLTSTHKGIIEWIHAQFGGWVYAYDNRQYKKTAIGFRWHSAARHAAWLLQLMLPHLIIKKPEAELAIAFQERVERFKTGPRLIRKGEPVLTPEEDAIRAHMAQELRDLKHAYKKYASDD